MNLLWIVLIMNVIIGYNSKNFVEGFVNILILLWLFDNSGKLVIINNKKMIIFNVLYLCFKIIFVKKILMFWSIIGIEENGSGIIGINFRIVIIVVIKVVYINCFVVIFYFFLYFMIIIIVLL